MAGRRSWPALTESVAGSAAARMSSPTSSSSSRSRWRRSCFRWNEARLAALLVPWGGASRLFFGSAGVAILIVWWLTDYRTVAAPAPMAGRD